MYEKISERSESMYGLCVGFPLIEVLTDLDLIIDDFADLIRAHYNISEFGDPSASTDVRPTLLFPWTPTK